MAQKMILGFPTLVADSNATPTIARWTGRTIPASSEDTYLLGELGGEVRWGPSKGAMDDAPAQHRCFGLDFVRWQSLTPQEPVLAAGKHSLVLAFDRNSNALAHVQHFETPCIFHTDIDLAIFEKDAAGNSHKHDGSLAAPLRINCAWHTVVIFGWPHVFLTSIPGVQIGKNDELVADWGRGWFLSLKNFRLSSLQAQLCGAPGADKPTSELSVSRKRSSPTASQQTKSFPLPAETKAPRRPPLAAARHALDFPRVNDRSWTLCSRCEQAFCGAIRKTCGLSQIRRINQK
eukprot:Selendium_serpulae@DN5926_c0_g1_i5.p1